MKKIKLTLGLLISITTLISCSNDEYNIKKTFEDFNIAKVENNGVKFYNNTDDISHQYYDELLNKILTLSKKELMKENVLEKFNILTLRGIVKDSILKNIDGKELMILAYKNSNNSTNSIVRKVEISNIEIDGQIAYATINNKEEIMFSKEKGIWKVNLDSFKDLALQQMNEIIKKNKISEETYLDFQFGQRYFLKKQVKPIYAMYLPVNKTNGKHTMPNK